MCGGVWEVRGGESASAGKGGARKDGAAKSKDRANANAPTKLVVPHLDLVIITTAHEERLGVVEVDAADGTVVLIEAIEQRHHPVVPQLHDPVMQRRKDPRPVRVERKTLHAVALRLELGEHR